MTDPKTTEDLDAEFEGSLSEAERFELFSHKERAEALGNDNPAAVFQHNRNSALWSIASELAKLRESIQSLRFVVRTPRPDLGPNIEKAVELANEGEST